ncbi:hypothetical protein [Virgibacillus litoralis]|uniref:Uncharacterized protein n=1 Tax=Virgibacillus litoralis TaxID=578221 RepID=A0ABS4HBL6_9BACI|nr:hypothetical protein [Virgibacillus litoralis]MBP1948286.1 hypothetical protein [Virgibacillus litoralis]
MTEECLVCGNTNEEEIEYKTVIIDDGWKGVKKNVRYARMKMIAT